MYVRMEQFGNVMSTAFISVGPSLCNIFSHFFYVYECAIHTAFA